MLGREARSTRLSALEPNTRYLICVLAVASWATDSTAGLSTTSAPDTVNASRIVAR